MPCCLNFKYHLVLYKTAAKYLFHQQDTLFYKGMIVVLDGSFDPCSLNSGPMSARFRRIFEGFASIGEYCMSNGLEGDSTFLQHFCRICFFLRRIKGSRVGPRLMCTVECTIEESILIVWFRFATHLESSVVETSFRFPQLCQCALSKWNSAIDFWFITHHIICDPLKQKSLLRIAIRTSPADEIYADSSWSYSAMEVIKKSIGQMDIVDSRWGRYSFSWRSWGSDEECPVPLNCLHVLQNRSYISNPHYLLQNSFYTIPWQTKERVEKMISRLILKNCCRSPWNPRCLERLYNYT